MDNIFNSEGLTKHIRSKTIKIDEIVNIVSKFDQLEFKFPNKEVFILELILDRWNAQKFPEFKSNYKIWRIFNDLWEQIDDDITKKKLFKNLKFDTHLIQSIQLVEQNQTEFLFELNRTCILINSCVTFEISTENSFKILSSLLKLIMKCNKNIEIDAEFKDSLVLNIIKLINLNYFLDTSIKLSNAYTDVLMLPTIEYLKENEQFASKETSSILLECLNCYIFGPGIDCTLQIEKFMKKSSANMDSSIAVEFYKKCMAFLSKRKLDTLETIFKILIETFPQITSELLEIISLCKRSLSQSFLESLLDSALNKNEFGEKTWNLIRLILKLNIEVGIKYCKQLMKMIENEHMSYESETLNIWKEINTCFINARAYMDFLHLWRKITSENQASTDFFSNNPEFCMIVSESLVFLSVSQLKEHFADVISKSINDSKDSSSMLILETSLKGLENISFQTLPELKTTLAKLFEDEVLADSNLWNARYLTMNVVDDVLDPETFDRLLNDQGFKQLLDENDGQIELYYFLFKIKEHKLIPFKKVVENFIGFMKKVKLPQKKAVIVVHILKQWVSLINTKFSSSQIEILIDVLLQNESYDQLKQLMIDDEFFEESQVVRVLISKLLDKIDEEMIVSLLHDIPLQCFHKSMRLELIEKLCVKSKFVAADSELIVHLLQFPTFKSKIEQNIDMLIEVSGKSGINGSIDSKLFGTIWSNHLTQVKEPNSANFISEAVSTATKKFESDNRYFEAAILILSQSPQELVENLLSEFIQRSLSTLSRAENTSKEVQLIIGLYEVLSKHKEIITDELVEALSVTLGQCGVNLTKEENIEFLESSFLLYSIIGSCTLEQLFAHYIALRSKGIRHEKILPAVNASIADYSVKNLDQYNKGFEQLIFAMNLDSCNYTESILELYLKQLLHLTKTNKDAVKLFANSLSAFYTNFERHSAHKSAVLTALKTFEELIVSKSWLFSQYSVEMLLPVSLKSVYLYSEAETNFDDVFIASTNIISNILLVFRLKATKRNHLFNTYFCSLMSLLSEKSGKNLSSVAAKALSRTIVNYCEPSDTFSSTKSFKNKLDSNASSIRKSIRKDVLTLLTKFVHLSILKPFEPKIRNELLPFVHSILNMVPKNDLTLMNSALDYSGKQYFKTIYSEYLKVGKWRED